MNFNPMQELQKMNQRPQFNPTQFSQMASRLNQQELVQLVRQARQQGISESDIEIGLKYIQQLKSYSG